MTSSAPHTVKQALAKRGSLRRAGLYSAIADRLREMIQEGELPPGSRIQEQTLCEHFDTSKTPLREALKVLVAEGLLTHRQHHGFRIAPVDIEEIESAFQVLHSLEEMAGRQIALHLEPDALTAIHRKHQTMIGHHRERRRSAYFRSNQELHQMIIDAARNPVLSAIYASLMAKVHRARGVANAASSRWDASMSEHEAVMQALSAAERGNLSRLLRQHSEQTCIEVMSALRQQAGA